MYIKSKWVIKKTLDILHHMPLALSFHKIPRVSKNLESVVDPLHHINVFHYVLEH